MEFKRHTINDVHNNRFFQLPKFLFEGEFKTALSAEAKLLYALLRDRHELSLQNGWVNDKNEVFLIYKREEMCDMLGCGMAKIRKLINELMECGLLEEERQGLNLPNLIYLNYINVDNISDKPFNDAECRKSTVQSVEKRQSRVSKFDSQDCRKSTPNKTNINNTKINDTDISINQSATETRAFENPAEIDMIENQTTENERDYYALIIRDNIELDYYQNNKDYAEFFNNAYELIIDTVASKAETIRIGKENMPKEVVKGRFLKLNSLHLEYVCDCLKNNTAKVSNIKNYLLTALYNAPITMESFYTAEVNHNFYSESLKCKGELVCH